MNHPPQDRELTTDASVDLDESSLSIRDVARSTERLTSVTSRLMTFLHSSIDQLRNVATEMSLSVHHQAALDEAARDHEARRADWDRQQELEAERIAEETRLLLDAWDQIEAERREMLTAKCVGEGLGTDPPEAMLPQTPRSLSDTDLFDLGVPRSSQQAAMQFQQIKREISNHARRNR